MASKVPSQSPPPWRQNFFLRDGCKFSLFRKLTVCKNSWRINVDRQIALKGFNLNFCILKIYLIFLFIRFGQWKIFLFLISLDLNLYFQFTVVRYINIAQVWWGLEGCENKEKKDRIWSSSLTSFFEMILKIICMEVRKKRKP